MLAWMTHTDLKKSCLPNTPQKLPNGGWYGSRGCFLPLPTKAAHRTTQLGQRGDLALPTVDLPVFFFFESIPKSPFLCLCVAVFVQEAPSFGPLIMFYKTLLGDMENLSFPFHCCDRMCFLKLLQNWPKLVLLWVWVLFLYLDQESLTQAHTAGHAGRSCLTFVPDAFFLCTSRDIFSICCW